MRHASDQPLVRQVLAGHGLDADAVLYLHADICRADLLVEIEAIGPARSVKSRQKQSIRGILGLVPVAIAKCCEKTVERTPFIGRNLQPHQHARIISTLVAVVEHRDVPARRHAG